MATTIHKSPLLKFKFNNIAVFIEHIKGYVSLNETSIIIAVACKHRVQAYEFSRYIIEEIKKRTPIWKKEHFVDGVSAWSKGCEAYSVVEETAEPPPAVNNEVP